MKKRKTMILLVLVLLFCIAAITLTLITREQRRNWDSVQIQRAIAIMGAVAQYRNDRGGYPNSLELLVSSGQIPVDRYHQLMFQDRPHGTRKAWIYHPPSTASSIAIVSPDPVIPWGGSHGVFITARADGGGELIAAGKIHEIDFPQNAKTEQDIPPSDR